MLCNWPLNSLFQLTDFSLIWMSVWAVCPTALCFVQVSAWSHCAPPQPCWRKTLLCSASKPSTLHLTLLGHAGGLERIQSCAVSFSTSCIGTCHLLETAERLLYLFINFDSVGFFFLWKIYNASVSCWGVFWGWARHICLFLQIFLSQFLYFLLKLHKIWSL